MRHNVALEEVLMPVRVALVGIGSRGDVQPYIALGQRFVDGGHPTTLVTTQEFAPLARSHGIEVEEVPVSVQAFISNPTDPVVPQVPRDFRVRQAGNG
ncbi:MAG: hypothetical protein EBT47_08650 [Chloroflexi bacterium]|nr:hypothetical protein [Chloroflexota bacterium]